MPYLVLDDFSPGLDVRKSVTNSRPGALRRLNNGFVTAGGEIHKRPTFTSIGSLPAGKTKGLAFNGSQAVVFGQEAPATVGAMPPHVAYQQLTQADGLTISSIESVSIFGQHLYVVALMVDGSTRHYHNGAHVTGAQGFQATPHKSKMFAIDGRNVRFSAVNDAADWSGTGSGLIDVTTMDGGAASLVGMEQYYGQLALFARNSIQVWAMDPDPALSTQQQVLGNIGLIAPNAVGRYGNGDVLFLSDTGIRSLRARDSSNAAVLNDIGSPIDALVSAKRAVLTPEKARGIHAIVDPLTGHFWMVWGNEIFNLAYYPNSKITAWSTYELPWDVDGITLANSRIAVRAGDQLFVYGSVPPYGSPFDPNTPIGNTAALYDGTSMEIVMPFADLGRPATEKHWDGLDVNCTGVWEVYANPDFYNPEAWVKVATVSQPTYGVGRVPIDFRSTHLSLRFKSTNTGPATFNSVAIHHNQGSAD